MKLLLIDAQPTPQSNWMRRRLEFENNQVSVSADWQTGWHMLCQSHYDIVLLNVYLSETSQIDTHTLWPPGIERIPLLLLISPDTPANKAWGLECGADDCVGYSIDIRELNARLYALYRRKTARFVPMSTLRIDNLEVNIPTKSIYRDGKRIHLLPREYSLLVFLLENQGRVVSKKEIIAHVWRTTVPVKSNTIEVYINYLRLKIDRQFSTKLIHTVTGMGYIMRAIKH